MKKFVILFVFFQYFSVINAETFLESLWKKAGEYDHSIYASSINIQHAMDLLKYKRVYYPFSLVSSLGSSFNDVYSDVTWYPASSTLQFSFSQELPGSLSISADVGYSVSRGVIDFFSDINREAIGFIHNPSVSLSLSQGLRPFWMQGFSKNPQVLLLEYSVEEQKINKDITEFGIIQTITYNYVQIRKYERQIRMMQRVIDVYDENIQAMRASYNIGLCSMSDIWALENAKWEYFEDLNEYIDQKQIAYKALRYCCGEFSEDGYFDVLPDAECTLYDSNPNLSLIAIKKRQMDAQFVLNRQDNAPTLIFSGSFQEYTKIQKQFSINYIDDKNYFDWSFTAAVDLSHLFSPNMKLIKKNYEYTSNLYSHEFSNYYERLKNNCSYYASMMQLYEKQLEQAMEMCANRKKYMEEMMILHNNGGCAILDMLKAEYEYFSACCIVENSSDFLWYYTWLRTQENELSD